MTSYFETLQGRPSLVFYKNAEARSAFPHVGKLPVKIVQSGWGPVLSHFWLTSHEKEKDLVSS
jgi:hypothetical protein